MRLARALSILAILAVISAASPQDARRVKKKVVFLGDSITYSGEYIAILETQQLLGLFPQLDVLDLGLPSETVSGLSEEGHADGKFPRPDLHERLDRILEKLDIGNIIACYGMNDGIYQPLDAGRFDKFKDGITRLHDKAVKAGVKIVHLTPPVYDPLPLGNGSRYDEVLDAYSAWLLEQKRDKGWTVFDIHGPMKAALLVRRRTDPKFTFAKDGVHPSLEGHFVIANALYHVDHSAKDISFEPADTKNAKKLAGALYRLVEKRQHLERDAWLSAIGHKRPLAAGLPLDQAEKKANEVRAEIDNLISKLHAP